MLSASRAHRPGAATNSSEELDGPQRQPPGNHAVALSNTDRLSGLSEDTTEQCQRVRHDGVRTVIGEEMCRAVDDVAAFSPCSARTGRGKTTVVKILSTLLKADAGTANIDGFEIATQAADVRESISLTGQFAAVDEMLIGRENLVLVGTCL